jgi:hypothetical protein
MFPRRFRARERRSSAPSDGPPHSGDQQGAGVHPMVTPAVAGNGRGAHASGGWCGLATPGAAFGVAIQGVRRRQPAGFAMTCSTAGVHAMECLTPFWHQPTGPQRSLPQLTCFTPRRLNPLAALSTPTTMAKMSTRFRRQSRRFIACSPDSSDDCRCRHLYAHTSVPHGWRPSPQRVHLPTARLAATADHAYRCPPRVTYAITACTRRCAKTSPIFPESAPPHPWLVRRLFATHF